MGIHSGYLGIINGLSTVREFTLNDNMEVKKFIASNTLSGSGRVKSIKSWGGSINLYGDIPPVMPSETFTFLGYTAPTTGVKGTNGMRHTGTAIVDSVVLTWNWQNGEIISNVLNFSGHLGLTSAVGAAVADATTPDVNGICGTKIQTSTDGVTFTDLDNVATATLTISAMNQAYVNSSTTCLTGRLPGPIDWTLGINRQDDVFFGTKGDDYQLKLFTNATEFWLLKWGILKDFTNLQVNIESNAIVSHQMNFEMQGVVGGVAGKIEKPGVTVWWPFA
jgi:hypothetical protein